MKIDIYFDEFMKQEERDYFLNELEQCKNGKEIGTLFDKYKGHLQSAPNRVYIFSKKKRFVHYGDVDIK